MNTSTASGITTEGRAMSRLTFSTGILSCCHRVVLIPALLLADWVLRRSRSGVGGLINMGSLVCLTFSNIKSQILRMKIRMRTLIELISRYTLILTIRTIMEMVKIITLFKKIKI